MSNLRNTYGYIPQSQNNPQMGMQQQYPPQVSMQYGNQMGQQYPNQMMQQYPGQVQQYPGQVGQQYTNQVIQQYPGQMQQYPGQVGQQYGNQMMGQFPGQMVNQYPGQIPMASQYPGQMQMNSQPNLRASQPISNPYMPNTMNPAMPVMPSNQISNTGAIPIQPVNYNSNNPAQMFLPQLTMPPNIGYIPPPPAFLDYKVNNSREKVFTNIYSSLAALNVIFDLFSNNVVSEEVKNQVFEQQMNLLIGNMGPGNIKTIDQLKQFAQMADLDISYCEKDINERLNPKETVQVQDSNQYFQFGESVIQFDNLLLVIENSQKYNEYRFQLQSHLSSLIRFVKGLYPPRVNELNVMEQYFNYITKFDKMDDRTIQRMKNDLRNVLVSVKNSLT